MEHVKKYFSKPGGLYLLCAAVLAASLTAGCGKSEPVPQTTAAPETTAVPVTTAVPETTQPVTEAPETEPPQPKELSITVNTPEDFLVLEGMTELESLKINLTRPTVLPELGELPGLQCLQISSGSYPMPAADLQILKSCPNLRELHILSVKLMDSSVFSKLTQLETLEMSYCKMSDFTPLSELKNLKTLQVHFTELRDLKPLAKLKNLEVLFLQACPVSNVRPLRDLKNLNHIELINTNVTDVTPLQNLPAWENGINLYGEKYDAHHREDLADDNYADFLTQEPYIRKKSEESVVAEYMFTAALRSDGYVKTTSEWGGDTSKWKNIVQIVPKHWPGQPLPGWNGILGLRRDGTVLEANTGLTPRTLYLMPEESRMFYKTDGQDQLQENFVPNEELKTWTDIVMLDSYQNWVTGLKSDGSVVMLNLEEGSKTTVVEGLHDIVDIKMHDRGLAALQSDGTVYGTSLTNVVDISGYPYCLTAQGTVICQSEDEVIQIEGWDHIVSVKPGSIPEEIYAIRDDGKVLTYNLWPEKAAVIEGWENIVEIYTGVYFYSDLCTVGVTEDGGLEIHVDATGYTDEELGTAKLENWWGIRKLFPGPYHTVGLRSDGKLVATGCASISGTVETPEGVSGEYLKCDVRDWVAVLLPE